MFVSQLSLRDFRSYPVAEVSLEPGVSVFVGANGQGKTNLVEAVNYIATLESHRVASDAPLIRKGAQQAVIKAQIQAGVDDNRKLGVEIQINEGRANKALVNRSPVRRMRDVLGSLRTVLFAPEDLEIVKGDPATRRHFLDGLLVQRWPRLAGVRADYDKALKQRNALLKSIAEGEGSAELLPIYDEQAARFGADILYHRLVVLGELNPMLATAYADIAPGSELAVASYKTSTELPENPTQAQVEEALLRRMDFRRPVELARGLTLVGPHRDDLTLNLGEFPAKGYASHGESWSYALALKLAAFELLKAEGMTPVLMLDDVFAELDETRRASLAKTAAEAEQVLITAAVASDVPEALGGRQYLVEKGSVRALQD
ncbi:MAG: DNA replication/repair protein RecF [Propionibacteriaceae bacterium]|jgi:DNA replication and repair protein RecF|nr:DNA replication/repair protein RecF [Propionibacteriaceae bacterium]